MLLGQPGYAIGEPELREAGNLLRNEAERERDRAALPVAVDAKAAEALGQIRHVELACDVEVLSLGGRALCDDREDGFEVRVGQEAFLHRSKSPVNTGHRRRRDLQVHIAAANLDQACEKAVQVHGRPAPIGRPSDAL